MLSNPPASPSNVNPARPHPQVLPQKSRPKLLVPNAAEYQRDAGQSKGRRLDRACDGCRRKKTKCDGPSTQDNVCTNCIQAKKPCTYIEASKPRGPPKAYVVGLEDRVEELEALLAQIKPGVDFSNELGPPVIRDSWKDNGGEERRAKKRRTADSTLASTSSQSGSPFHQPPSLSSPSPASLPPLVIPFHQDVLHGSSSSTARTTHLLLNPRPNGKKRRSGRKVEDSSSSSVVGPMTGTSGSGHRSNPSPASAADSTSESQSEASDSDSEELVETSLAGRNRITLKINETPHAGNNKITFHGRSSTAGLVEATRQFKQLHMEETMQMQVEAVDDATDEKKSRVQRPDNAKVASTRRPEFWQTPAWELGKDGADPSSLKTVSSGIAHRFPPDDLCVELINLYFVHCNTHFPLLHRPTFEQQWKDRLQDTNFWFSATSLLLFAVASRWSNDERVLPKPEDRHPTDQFPPWRPPTEGETDSVDGNNGRSPAGQSQEQCDSHAKPWWYAGMTYADAASDIIRANANMAHSVSLFEVQALALMGQYLRTTTGYPAAWLIVSIGLRRAIDAGAHRKRVYTSSPSAEAELWKRAFWHLVVFDRLGGVVLGRSVGIGEEDFDLELPLEVDDPYWGDEHGWKQPENVPCTISFFTHFIKLTQVIAFTSRTIYAINKTKLFTSLIKGDWRSEVLTQLNAALEEWIESIPTHLKWSKDIPDPVFYSLSATLITTYYLTRMLMYRPFIPPPPLLPQSLRERIPASAHSAYPVAFPALAICISSARACTRVLEHQYSTRNWEMMHIPNFFNAAYVCAGVFLLAFWDLKGQQKALVKIHGAGVISTNDGQGECGSRERETASSSKQESAEDLDTEQVLNSLKEKMAELLADVRLLIEALEWLEPKWQGVSPWIAQLKQSLPQEEDLEERTPSSYSAANSRKGSFQDLRRQRQQEKMKQPPQAEGVAQHSLRDRSSRSSLLTPGSASSQQYSHQGSDIEPPDPALFIHENYAHLHTFPDEDTEEVHDQRIQIPRVEYNAPTGPHGPGPSRLYMDHPQHARSSPYSKSPPSPLVHTSRNIHEVSQHHDQRSHLSDDRIPRHHQHGVYDPGDFSHPDSVTLPYISNAVRRPSFAPPRSTLNHRRDSLPPPPPPSQRMLTTRTPSFDDFRSTAIPHRFRSPMGSPSRSSISMDRSTIHEDRKPSIGIPPFEFPPRGRRDDNSAPFAYDADRRFQRADTRAGGPSSYSAPFPPDVELRYPWSSQDTHAHHHPVIPSSSVSGWKGHPTHYQHQGAGQSGRLDYPSTFPPYQQVALPVHPQRSTYEDHADASRTGPYGYLGFGHGP